MSDDTKATISPMQNGPYIVKNITKLSNVKGQIEAVETVALCRCGASANKPFCDGSHQKIGFNSDKKEGRLDNKQDTYSGDGITIYDNRSICAHAGVCTDNLSAVFRVRQEPFVDVDAASIEDITKIIDKCPSGALSYSINKDNDSAVSDVNSGIMVAPSGPYVVSGDVDLLETQWGEGASKEQFTLCRCGASKNKPFCDGSHWAIEFKDEKN